MSPPSRTAWRQRGSSWKTGWVTSATAPTMDSFIELYDETMATLGGVWRGFIGEAQALAAAKSAPVVNPLRQEDEEVSATAE